MIKDNQKTLNTFHVFLDAIMIAASFLASYYLRFKSPLTNLPFYELDSTFGAVTYINGFGLYFPMLFYLVPGYIAIYYLCNLYTPKRSKNRFSELGNLIQANILGVLYFTFILYYRKETNLSRVFIGTFFIVNTTIGYLFRLVIIRTLKFFRKKGYNMKHIVIVGYSRAAERYINRVNSNPEWGYRIHGILDDRKPIGSMYKGIKVIGTLESLHEILAKNELDEIAVALRIEEYSNLEHIVRICEKSGVHTKFIPDYHNIIPTKPYMEDLDGLPVINIRNVPLSNTWNMLIKRIFDIFGAIGAIIIFAIPMLIVACIIKLTSPGPLIFCQVRVGLHNKEFKMYKFRSMKLQSAAQEKKAWTTANDPRITGIGKFIRKTSIDELPQLFNVLKGDMSLVGPRPERPFFVEKFKEEIPRYMIKHQVRPGMTGWAQVKGYRGDTSIKSRIEHDLYYIENWTMGMDIKILFMTVFNGFVNKNAY